MDHTISFAINPNSPAYDSLPRMKTIEDMWGVASTEYEKRVNQFKGDSPVVPDAFPDDIDSLVANELGKMSIQEREKVYHDLHGVSDAIEETPELLESAFVQLEEELNKLKEPDAYAYKLALEIAPKYIRDRKFRLRFLRADMFDAKKAADRFALYMKYKLDLFGKEKLGKDITQDDLDDEALCALYSGCTQQLPLRDRSGRAVQIRFGQSPDVDLRANLITSFYMTTVMSEDEETQRRGVVTVAFMHKQAQMLSKQKGSNAWQTPRLSTAVPIRFAAIHFAHDSRLIWTPLVTMAKILFNVSTRIRVREHCGTQQETLFSLQTYGIPVAGCFPFSEEGKILTSYHHDYLKKRRNIERMRENKVQNLPAILDDEEQLLTDLALAITIPNQYDVLLGRGKRYYEHQGNVRFRYWVDERVQAYNEAESISEKKAITSEVVNLVKGIGGRFLKDDNFSGWVEVDYETARLKVSHVFRNMRANRVASCNTVPKKGDVGGKRSREATTCV